MKPSELLDAAADLIEPPGKWTQGWFARDASGLPTYYKAKRACQWCAIGAVKKVSTEKASVLALVYLERVLRNRSDNGMVSFNDRPGRRKGAVIAKIRKAAQLAREAGR